MKKLSLIISSALLLTVLTACTHEAVSESTPTPSGSPAEVTRTVIPEPSPAPETPVGNFRADNVYTTVNLPVGWAGVTGPEPLSMMRLYGAVAFNNWGQNGFWARAVVINRSAADSSGPMMSVTFSDKDVRSQVPDGGAYVSLMEIHGPPNLDPANQPAEYTPNDLSGLITPHDWRQDYSPQVEFFSFHKWGRSLNLVVACRTDASDATVAALNDLLQSWRFDAVPSGDPGWAITIARQLLPEQAHPEYFPSSGGLGMTNVNYRTEVNVLPDKTVHFKFIYIWGLSPPPMSSNFDVSLYPNHWWEIDVLPTGKAVLAAQGGEPLPPAISP